MGGPALLPTAVPPPKNKQKFPWQVATVPVPKPARNVARRPGVHPFADMAAGFGDLISSISRGEKQQIAPLTICNLRACSDSLRRGRTKI